MALIWTKLAEEAETIQRTKLGIANDDTAGQTQVPPGSAFNRLMEARSGESSKDVSPSFNAEGDPMTKTVTALLAAAILATATCALLTTAHARCVGCAIGAVDRPADAALTERRSTNATMQSTVGSRTPAWPMTIKTVWP